MCVKMNKILYIKCELFLIRLKACTQNSSFIMHVLRLNKYLQNIQEIGHGSTNSPYEFLKLIPGKLILRERYNEVRI